MVPNKQFVTTLFIVFPLFFTAFCKAEARSKPQISLGIGVQYGPLAGIQYAQVTQSSKYFVSYGFMGLSIGYQLTLDKDNNHAVGLNTGVLADILGGSTQAHLLTYNYHPNGLSNGGWAFGISTGIKDHTSRLINGEEIRSHESITTVNIGYKF